MYADGPGGTQVPLVVIDAIADALSAGIGNIGGAFVASEFSDGLVASARGAAADLFNAGSPEEISFGQNMTSITLALGRALARTWEPGDEIVCTRLDHDANVSSWMQAASEAGAVVRLVDFDTATGRLDPGAVAAVVSKRTRLLAVTHASNALGSTVDVGAVATIAHSVGALCFVDAVHYTPHSSIDVAAIGCDFLVASSYKFFGPHTGVLWGRHDLMSGLDAVRIRPAPEETPGKWETGTQSFESLAGVAAAVDYLASLGDGGDRREELVSAMGRIAEYERSLSQRFIDGVARLEGVHIHGVATAEGRTPTFAVSVDGVPPDEVARRLGSAGIFVWDGHYYALEVMRSLGLLESGGLVRIGFVHYNTTDEVDRTLAELALIAV